MPFRPSAHPERPDTADAGGGRGPDARPSAHRRGYGRRWRKLRAAIAATVPAICVDCERSYPSNLMHLDHDQAKSKGGTDDPTNLKWRCQGCHSIKTVTEDGGFGRDKTPRQATLNVQPLRALRDSLTPPRGGGLRL